MNLTFVNWKNGKVGTDNLSDFPEIEKQKMETYQIEKLKSEVTKKFNSLKIRLENSFNGHSSHLHLLVDTSRFLDWLFDWETYQETNHLLEDILERSLTIYDLTYEQVGEIRGIAEDVDFEAFLLHVKNPEYYKKLSVKDIDKKEYQHYCQYFIHANYEKSIRDNPKLEKFVLYKAFSILIEYFRFEFCIKYIEGPASGKKFKRVKKVYYSFQDMFVNPQKFKDFMFIAKEYYYVSPTDNTYRWNGEKYELVQVVNKLREEKWLDPRYNTTNYAELSRVVNQFFNIDIVRKSFEPSTYRTIKAKAPPFIHKITKIVS